MSGGDKSFPIRFGKSGQGGGRLVGENGLEWFLLIPFQMPGRLLVDPVARKHGLGIERMFDPKGAILIERDAAVCRLGVLGARLVSYLSDEGHDGLLRHFVPGRK